MDALGVLMGIHLPRGPKFNMEISSRARASFGRL